jgi:V-type H+-transporting ATPase subunit a
VTSVTVGFLETQIENAGVRIRYLTEPESMSAPSAHELDLMDESTARFEERVAHLLESKETLEKRHAELIEFRHVLRETASFFSVCPLTGEG